MSVTPFKVGPARCAIRPESAASPSAVATNVSSWVTNFGVPSPLCREGTREVSLCGAPGSGARISFPLPEHPQYTPHNRRAEHGQPGTHRQAISIMLSCYQSAKKQKAENEDHCPCLSCCRHPERNSNSPATRRQYRRLGPWNFL